GHGLDELDLHERPRRVVDQHHAKEPLGQLGESRQHRVLAPLAARHHGAELGERSEQRARRARFRVRNHGDQAPDRRRRLERARRAQQERLAPELEERLRPLGAHALAAPRGDDDRDRLRHEGSPAARSSVLTTAQMSSRPKPWARADWNTSRTAARPGIGTRAAAAVSSISVWSLTRRSIAKCSLQSRFPIAAPLKAKYGDAKPEACTTSRIVSSGSPRFLPTTTPAQSASSIREMKWLPISFIVEPWPISPQKRPLCPSPSSRET